jgi:hypothetical protein
MSDLTCAGAALGAVGYMVCFYFWLLLILFAFEIKVEPG